MLVISCCKQVDVRIQWSQSMHHHLDRVLRESGAMKFLFGLGNPEAKYNNTPHNVGYATIDRVAELLGLSPITAGTGVHLESGEKIFICKPTTVYMNESGRHIKEMLDYYKVEPSVATLAIIHDDLDIPIGHLRGRVGGSSGGHNGIKSIIEELDTEEFFRLKIGIGRHEHMDPYTYVLSKMDDDRLDLIERMIDKIARRAIEWLQMPADKEYQGFTEGPAQQKEIKDERNNMRSGKDNTPSPT